MKKKELIEKIGLTAPIIAKFAKNEYVSGETLEKLCSYFQCQYSDIIEHIPEK